ncbi:MAG: hypothetical protein LBM92_01430, partial [Opitutaceae bacterium]|nr:hypothetical protein [Opitutaceae bacterium]
MTGAKNKKISSAWRVCKTCANGCCTLLTWVVCAFLALLLFFQIRLATLDEIELSGEALRRLESRFTAHGLSAVFDSARIDLRGNILVRGVRVRANAFEDPLLAIDALQCRVDPVAFLLHRVAPETVRVSGASLRLPAMLSPSGAGEPVVHDIDLALSFHDRILSVEHLTARVENLTLSARGSLMLPQSAGGISWEKIRDAIAGYRARNRRRDEPPGSEEVRAALTGYLAALRNIAGVAGRLAVLDSPHLQLSLAPSRREIATVDAVFSFDGLSVAADKLPPQFQAILARAQSLAGSEPEPAGPLPVLALGPASARLQFPLNPAAPRQPALRARLETLDLPGGIHARNIHLDIPLNLGPASAPVGPDLASGREAQSPPQTTGQFRQHTSRSRPDTRSGPTSAAPAPPPAQKNPPPITRDSSLNGETARTNGVHH